MILTEIGEVGVHWDGRELLLRPSLYAVSQIGSPKEIVEIFARVMNGPEPGAEVQLLEDSLNVIYCCGDSDLAAELFGAFEFDEGGRFTFVPGAAATEDTVHIARCLLKHGVVGALPPLEAKLNDPPTYSQDFDARAHVATAMAHLGLSEHEAWAMTMTGLVGALRAKFPPVDDGSSMTRQELDEALEWLDAVDAIRKDETGGDVNGS